jgi:hypothetical protein
MLEITESYYESEKPAKQMKEELECMYLVFVQWGW